MKKRTGFMALVIFLLLTVSEAFSLEGGEAKNLGPIINTDGESLSPSVSHDGTTLVFSMKKKGARQSDIYTSSLVDGAWTAPEAMTALNSDRDDESPFLSLDGSMIVFSSNREGSARPKDFTGDERSLPHDIYISYRTGSDWSKPERVVDSINSADNERAPSLSRDNSVMYFTRWPGNDADKAKIMAVNLTDEGFSNPREMEAPINDGRGSYGFAPSRFREGAYFSSKRPGGSGSWDLYFAVLKSGKYTDPVNLGPRINSPYDEISAAELDRETILFSSNRPGSTGRYDLYSSAVPSDMGSKVIGDATKDGSSDGKMNKAEGGFNFRFVQDGTRKPLHARFRLIPKEAGGKEAGSGKEIMAESDKDGVYAFVPGPGVVSVLLESMGDATQTFRKEYKVDQRKMKDIIIALKLKDGSDGTHTGGDILDPDDFRPIYFETNSAKIKTDDIPYLYEIVYYLRKNENVRIRIMGHSGMKRDCRSDERISVMRARMVGDYIASFGIDKNRIIVRGYGNKYPADERYNELNRRVEFVPVK